MTPRAATRFRIARVVLSTTIVAAVVMFGVGVVQARKATDTNRQAIHAIQNDRRVRISQINEAALALCGYSKQGRELQRQSIRDQPKVVTDRARATGATPAQIQRLRTLTVARMELLLERYPAIVCPSTFVTGRP